MNTNFAWIILSIIVVLSFTRCDNQKKPLTPFEIADKKNDIMLKELTESYNVKYLLDTISYKYTVEFEDLLDSEYQLVDWFQVNDIYRENGLIKARIGMASWRGIKLLELIISNKDKDKLISYTDLAGGQSKNSFLLVKLNSIRKIKFELDCEEDEGYCYLDMTLSNEYIGEGFLKDIFIAE